MSGHFTLEDIKNDKTVVKFFRKKKGRKPKTLDSYLYPLKSFSNFTGKSPTEIHNIHRKELRSRTPEFDMWLNDAFDDYVEFLIDEGKQPGTIKLYVGRIKSFLHTFKLRPTPEPEISLKEVREDFKYALTVEDIQKAIEESPLTYKVYFITQAQTGLSVVDVLLLDVEDFISAVSKKNEDLTVKEAIYRAKTEDNLIGCFDLRRKKTTREFYTFAGPEVLRNIAKLIESREEELKRPEMPIFMKDTSRLRKKDRKKHYNPEDLRLGDNAVKLYVHRLTSEKKLFPKIEVNGKEKNYFRTHKIRKWFGNQLKNVAGIDRDDVKFLMGQKTGDVIERYVNPNDYNNLKNNYRKALPHLAINYDISMEENLEAIEQLEAKNEVLKEQLEQQKEEMKLQKEQHQREMAEMEAKMEAKIDAKIEDNEKRIFDFLANSKKLDFDELKKTNYQNKKP